VNDCPVFVPTEFGPLGGVVTVPDGPPRGAVMLLQGADSTRAGPNAVWTRTARAIAATGHVVLRVDYVGIGDSDLIELAMDRNRLALRQAFRWFVDRCEVADIAIVGSCLGAQLAIELASTPEVTRLALLVPPMISPTRELPPDVAGVVHDARQKFEDCVTRLPVWVLVGEHDAGVQALIELAQRLQNRATFEVEIVPELALHTYASPEAQLAAISRVASWSADPTRTHCDEHR